jgi:hypothetical protein
MKLASYGQGNRWESVQVTLMTTRLMTIHGNQHAQAGLLDKTNCMRASRAAQHWLWDTEEYELWGSAN